MIKINRLLDDYHFSESYLNSYLKNMTQLSSGKNVQLEKKEIIALKEKISLTSKINPNIKSQTEDEIRLNLGLFLKKILKKEFILFQDDIISIVWNDFSNEVETFDLKQQFMDIGLLHSLQSNIPYNLKLKVDSRVNILDFVNEYSMEITNFLFEEIYVRFNKKLIKKRSRADSLFKFKSLKREEILNQLIVSYPDSGIEKEVNNFLVNYSLDPLLEIYKKLED